METVQLQCGSCHKVMAISTEHLGGQVRCPHCQTVVQTPPRSAPAPAPGIATDVMPPHVEASEVESIFAPEAPSEDVFDAGPPRQLVEMPSRETDDATVAYVADAHPAQQPSEEASAEAGSAMAAFKRPRPAASSGMMPLMLLIFLVPYAVLMTLFVVYLLYLFAQQPHPLDFVPDPNPKKGARQVERIKHDQPLAEHQKVPLGKTVRIGALEVTPQRVQRDEFGGLTLVLHVKNVSKDQAFSPMNPEFLKAAADKGPPPYTFLDSSKFVRLYGGHLAYRRNGPLTDEGELTPGQEEDVEVTTGTKDVVKKIVGSGENLTWRVQLRRGLVSHRGQSISTTAVIGVQFNANDVKKG